MVSVSIYLCRVCRAAEVSTVYLPFAWNPYGVRVGQLSWLRSSISLYRLRRRSYRFWVSSPRHRYRSGLRTLANVQPHTPGADHVSTTAAIPTASHEGSGIASQPKGHHHRAGRGREGEEPVENVSISSRQLRARGSAVCAVASRIGWLTTGSYDHAPQLGRMQIRLPILY